MLDGNPCQNRKEWSKEFDIYLIAGGYDSQVELKFSSSPKTTLTSPSINLSETIDMLISKKKKRTENDDIPST